MASTIQTGTSKDGVGAGVEIALGFICGKASNLLIIYLDNGRTDQPVSILHDIHTFIMLLPFSHDLYSGAVPIVIIAFKIAIGRNVPMSQAAPIATLCLWSILDLRTKKKLTSF